MEAPDIYFLQQQGNLSGQAQQQKRKGQINKAINKPSIHGP
jgi:hypothetical protein